MQQFSERERSLEAQLEEANKQVRALKEDADNLKDTETVEAQHVQVGRSSLQGHLLANCCNCKDDQHIQGGRCSCQQKYAFEPMSQHSVTLRCAISAQCDEQCLYYIRFGLFLVSLGPTDPFGQLIPRTSKTSQD